MKHCRTISKNVFENSCQTYHIIMFFFLTFFLKKLSFLKKNFDINIPTYILIAIINDPDFAIHRSDNHKFLLFEYNLN